MNSDPETAFGKINTALRSYRVFLRSASTNMTPQMEMHIQNIMQSFNEFLKKSKCWTEQDKQQFLISHRNDLMKMWSLLVGIEAKLTNQTISPNFRSIVDKMRARTGYHPSAMHGEPATLLKTFLRGITYFNNQPSHEWPIYHRDASCGTKTKTYREKFEDAAKNPDKQKILETCYIERMVFDELHRHYIGKQDIRHEVERKRMEILWQDANPGQRIKIEIAYDENDDPVLLQIIRMKDPHHIEEELYMKTDPNTAECTRTVHRLFKRRSPLVLNASSKVQSFMTGERPWHPSAAPRSAPAG